MSTDIYKISEFVNQLQKKHIPVAEDTLYMGMLGYMNETYSNIMQNSIVSATEWGNEIFPIRAKYEKDLLTYAVMYGVDNLNATPAKMSVMLGIIEKELLNNMDGNSFTLYKDCKIIIEDFEYHLDYDIIITRTKLPNGNYTYAARYDMAINNTVSDIENPYLPPVYFLNIEQDNFLFLNCIIRQVEETKIYKKIISNNILENKTFDFEFNSQLVAFSLKVTEDGVDTYLQPIFEGMPLNNNQKYCYYNYIDSNTIRIKFDRKSYEPKLNCDIELTLKTTQGSLANFMYRDDIILTLKSEKIDYKNLSVLIKPISDSVYGIDRKSMDQLREIIPKQILARGTISTDKDLDNFFNTIDNNKLYFYKKRDNQIERLFYAYMIFKDSKSNIIPSNTLKVAIRESEFTNNYDNRYSFSLEKLLEYNDDKQLCIVNKDELSMDEIIQQEKEKFLYTSPFTCVINKKPLSVSYYLNNINNNYYLKFSYINGNSELQFISTSMFIRRIALEDKDYIITMDISQNMIAEKGLITIDKTTGKILDCNIKPMLYIDNNEEKYYVEGEIVAFNSAKYTYTVKYRLKTDCIIDEDNRIRIDELILSGNASDAKTYSYIRQSVNMSFYIFAKLDKEYGRYNSDSIFPNMNGYTLCNIYDTQQKVDLFYNYSNVINSTVVLNDVYDVKYICDGSSSLLSIDGNKLPVSIADFDKSLDSVLLFRNSVLTTDYTISDDSKNILKNSGNWIDDIKLPMYFDTLFLRNTKSSYKQQVINSNKVSIDIGIDNYDKSKDTLIVFKNSVLLQPDKYTISDDSKLISTTGSVWVASTEQNAYFDFYVIKNTLSTTNQIILNTSSTTVDISSLAYNKTTDTLLVFKNTTYFTDYTIDKYGKLMISKNLVEWDGITEHISFDFIVIKNVKCDYRLYTNTGIDSGTVPINIEILDRNTDGLISFKNSTLITDYTISYDNKYIVKNNGGWGLGQNYFEFVYLRNVLVDNNEETITSSVGEVDINVAGYNKNNDGLIVFKDNVLYRPENYQINDDGTKIIKNDGNWIGSDTSKTFFEFVVVKDTFIRTQQIILNRKVDSLYIGSLDFNKNRDRILVFKNTTYYTDYTFDADFKNIVCKPGIEWDGSQEPIIFDFVILKDARYKALNDLNSNIKKEFAEYEFIIKNIPLVRYSYANDVSRYEYLLEYLQYRKIYIDTALEILENSFSIDLKFFNTYGKSRIFKIGHNGENLDKVNLTLNFRIKLKTDADNCKEFIIQEIKNYIEDINTDITSIHMSNLTTDLENKFKSDIEYIEFLGINNYNALYQYIEKDIINDVETVPEFLNINLSDNENPDINIVLV